MFSIFDISKKLWDRLQKKAYRQAYLAEHVRRGIAYQIRALRDQRGWKQGKFAAELGKPQSVVSRLEDPDYGKVTVQTLLEVAAVFDVALQIRFVPFSTFIRSSRDVSPSSMQVPEFKDDHGFKPINVLVRSGAARSIATGWINSLGRRERTPIMVLPNPVHTDGAVNVVH
ncbi:helix-turn-helix domain-containing protein [Bradyrhizobium sp. USDA 329]|uniref:helix-turn-helix domain-containing protein n=1 Tax=unclassified Bradyrhizobium TaxID=2631580 RepID=UPI00351542A0